MKRNQKKRICLAALLAASVLTILTTACKTTPKIEYIFTTPSVTFPVFPPPDCVTFDEKTDLVSMPLWYWQKIAEYKIDVDAISKYLKQLNDIEINRDKK